MVRIDLKPLKNGPHEFDWNPSPEVLDLDPAVFSDLALHVRLDVQPGSVYARCDVRGVARLVCDRTLVPYDEPVSGRYAMLFVPRGAEDAPEDATDDVIELDPEDDEIDLTSYVRDTLLLALPQRRVAPGAEAAELPTTFGAPPESDAEIDPRWEALRALRGPDAASGT